MVIQELNRAMKKTDLSKFLQIITFVFTAAVLQSACMSNSYRRFNQFDKQSRKTGTWIVCDSSGWFEIQQFQAGVPHGTYKKFRDSGVLAISGSYKKGNEDGMWRYFQADGRPVGWSKFRNGRVVRDLIGELSF